MDRTENGGLSTDERSRVRAVAGESSASTTSSYLERWSPAFAIEYLFNRFFDGADSNKAIAILLGSFVAIWTSFQILSYSSIDLHSDLVESFSWSQHLAAGYKHPPLTAIIVAAWFS